MDQLKPHPASTCPLTPLGFLERAATVYGDYTSIFYNEMRFTWSETNRRCVQLASALSSIGIGRGDVVSVVAPNIPAMYELQFAVPMSGAILNNINTRLDARTVSVLLEHGESKLVFIDQFCSSLVLEAVSHLPSPPKLVLICEQADENSASSQFFETYERLVRKGDPLFQWVRPKTEYEPMILNYTSGTTSAPKGVVHSHRGMYLITMETLLDWAVPKNPVYLWTLPMFHANGWSYPWGMAAVGGTNVCLRKVDVSTIFGLIKRLDVTHMCGAPVVLNMLSNSPDAETLEKPVNIMTAGAPPPASVLSKTESLGFVVTHGYGLTEVGGTTIHCAWKRQWNKLPAAERARLKARQGVRTAGFAGVDVLDAESGESVDRDGKTQGEVVFKGGSVMLGYLKDPVATSLALKENGWFYSGDVGVFHPDGYLEIKDRSKDVIISGGENISSTEVESVIHSHPAINEAAVVARPHEFWGETPCAFVSLKPGLADKPTEKEMLQYCRDMMPHYMVPKTVVFMDELPKTSTGKFLKFKLRELAQSM